MRTAMLLSLLALAGCDSKPSPEACNDYRWMTFAMDGGLGWTNIVSRKVCVVSERSATK